ncbi:hypothetical protein ACUALU_19375, partial [Nocardiopsis changdeensis]
MPDPAALAAHVMPPVVHAVRTYGPGAPDADPAHHPGVRLLALLTSHRRFGPGIRGAVAELAAAPADPARLSALHARIAEALAGDAGLAAGAAAVSPP